MLSKRLLQLADFIPKNEIVADVGSDHGLLLCYLAEKQSLNKGYAIDIAEGPLTRAQENITRGAYTNITTILSNGLNDLPADTSVVVIAGLGYLTIKGILQDNWDKLWGLEAIIVQCNSQIKLFRKFLGERRVNILDECWVKDYKDYQLIKFNLKEQKDYSEAESYFGPYLLQRKPPEFLDYYHRYYKKIKRNFFLNQKNELKNEINLIREFLQDFF